jgi:3-oxocholest-4-en-26-oate---CoA ligase
VLTWNLADLFEAVVDAVGERTAIAPVTVELSYDALDVRASRLANALVHLGCRPGDRIGLCMRNSHEYLEAMLAAFKVRAVPVNVNTRYTRSSCAICSSTRKPRSPSRTPSCRPPPPRHPRAPTSRTGSSAGAKPTRSSSPTQTRSGRRSPAPGDDRYVLYTGGTTGAPKGVLWATKISCSPPSAAATPGGDPVASPEEVVEHARAGRTRCLPASPFTHGTAHWTALATLLNGGTVIIDTAPAFDAARLWDLADRARATVLVIVGDGFARPLADALAADPDRWTLDDLLVVLSGGAVLSPVVRSELLARLPWVVVVDGYGTSETGGQGQMPIWAGQSAGALPRFHVDEHTTVLDDAGRPAPPGSGIVGRLARRGRLPLGYLGDPGGAASTFVEIDGQRWAIPGDLARVEADGSVTLLGRGSSSINTGGEKVFAEEVEMVLKGHPDVFDAVVVGIPDDRFGQRVAAVVAARASGTLDLADLDRHARTHLAAFKVPRRTVEVPEICRRPSGKADLEWARRSAISRGAATSEPA